MLLTMIFLSCCRAPAFAAGRICDVFGDRSFHTGRRLTDGLDGITGTVEFKNVSFRYPDAKGHSFGGISFTAKKGRDDSLYRRDGKR